jgi:hypothetical protein
MLSQILIDRRTRSHGCPEAALLPPIDPAPLRIHRDHQIQASNGSGFEVRWHVGGPWPAQSPAAIGALRGFHHATLEPSATWPMHIQEDLQGVTYVVAGALEHADILGNRGVLTAGGVHQRWLGWAPSTKSGTRLRLRQPSSSGSGLRRLGHIQPSSHPPTTLRMSASSIGCRSLTRIDPAGTRVSTSHDSIPRPAVCSTGSSRAAAATSTSSKVTSRSTVNTWRSATQPESPAKGS